MREMTYRASSVGSGRYWHYSDPTHSCHVSQPRRVAGARSIWCTVREDWPLGSPRWLATAHVEVQVRGWQSSPQERVLHQHFATEDEALAVAREWLSDAALAAPPSPADGAVSVSLKRIE